MLGLRTSPRRWREHLSNKLKDNGFIQDERDPCMYKKLNICIGVHVGDMLAVGPSESTKTLLQELAKVDHGAQHRKVTNSEFPVKT